MTLNLITIDNFYNNVDEVRNFALSQEFNVSGNYPGMRTKSFINENTKQIIENILSPHVGKITDWLDDPTNSDGYTGSFQLTTSQDKSWVHVDRYNDWAGVLYLTPNAPSSGGTGFFKSKIDGSYFSNTYHFPDYAYIDMSRWEVSSVVANVYNRLILFRSNQWHTSLDYFGDSKNDGRLTQVFFIKTEK